MTTTIPSRCWRFQAFTDYNANPRIEYLREKVTIYEDGRPVSDRLPTIQRDLADIATQPIAGGPVTCTTMADVYALVANCGHQFAVEDDAAIAAQASAAAAAKAAQTTTTTP